MNSEEHVAHLLGGVLSQLREDLAGLSERRFAGLRASHFRVLGLIPEEGARPTDLVRTAGMTKQALGQFFGYLEDRGYVTSAADPADRRARIVRRTGLGDAAAEAAAVVIAERERQWRDLVGARRYAAFRSVLRQIAIAADVL